MYKTWPVSIFIITFFILAAFKAWQNQKIGHYFKQEKSLKLETFENAKKIVTKDELELLKLWESTITGRSAPLSKVIKDKYKLLGLNHIFTPSGFHLSAVLYPFMKLFKKNYHQLILLFFIGIGLSQLSGFSALKRMVLIKINQRLINIHAGFITAILLDVFFGSFQNNLLSFTYSFLFLGIIYSGKDGVGLIFWFFLGQILIAYFQNLNMSLLIILFSPLLNFIFGMIMPILFLLSIPLWEWQIHSGIFLLKYIQHLVDILAFLISTFPTFEVNFVTLLIFIFFICKRWTLFVFFLCLFSSSLNHFSHRTPALPKTQFKPKGSLLKTIYKEDYVSIYFEDGKCRLKLVNGYWWENCSPLRRSNYLRKKVKKPSYPS